MTNAINLGDGRFVLIDGLLVERDALRIAEAVKEYDPNLDVMYLDPDRTDNLFDEPYIIVEKCPDGQVRKVFGVFELNEQVLERIKLCDGARNNGLKTLQQLEQEKKLERTRRYEEKRLEAADVTYHVAGMKSKYTWKDPETGEMVTFYDDRPTERK